MNEIINILLAIAVFIIVINVFMGFLMGMGMVLELVIGILFLPFEIAWMIWSSRKK